MEKQLQQELVDRLKAIRMDFNSVEFNYPEIIKVCEKLELLEMKKYYIKNKEWFYEDGRFARDCDYNYDKLLEEWQLKEINWEKYIKE